MVSGFVAVAVWGGLVCSAVIFLKKDIKTFVAYRSVIHMGLVVVGVLSGTPFGLAAAVTTMLAHGLRSSGLFFLAAAVARKTGGRGLPLIKGMLVAFPKLMLFLFVVAALNIAAPPSLNLLGELLTVVPFLQLLPWCYPLLGAVMFLRVAINIFLYCRVAHGKLGSVKTRGDLKDCQLLCLAAHLVPYGLLFKLELFS